MNGEGESTGCSSGRGGVAYAWVPRGGYVARSFCALDTHGGALVDRPRVGRRLSGVLTWHDLTWSWLTKKGAVLMN